MSLLRQFRYLLATILVLATVTIAAAIARGPRYMVSGLIVPSSSTTQTGGAGGLLSLAGRLGIGAGMDGTSLEYYQMTLTSAATLDKIARSCMPTDSGCVPMHQLFRTTASDTALQFEKTVTKLAKAITVEVEDEAGLLQMRVVARSPEVAGYLFRALIAQANTLNSLARVERAESSEATYERILGTFADSLRRTEVRLQNFYESNRGGASSPGLSAQEARLRRQLALDEAVYADMQKQVQAARIERLRDVPSVISFGEPHVWAKPVFPNWPLLAVTAVAASFFLYVSTVLLLGALPQLRAATTPLRELVEAGQAALTGRPSADAGN